MAERIEAPAALMGKPDGPHVFVPELGLEVPTFVDPREDLIDKKAHGFKRMSHHVPFNMRGPFKPQWLPPKFFAMYGHNYICDSEGYVLCFGQNKAGNKCPKRAMNRTPYCPNHGGALHPADKRLSSQNISISKIEPERIEALDRVQKFMAGFITVADLDDDEIMGAYVRNNDGRPISNEKLGSRFQQDMVKELMNRMQRFMTMKLPNMLKVLADLAESDFVEPADRYKCATWLAERVLGKVPDVVFHGSTDQPYERMLSLASGSREEHRRRVLSSRPEEEPLTVAVVDDETELEPDMEGSNGVSVDRNRSNGSTVSIQRDTDDEGKRIQNAGIESGEDTGTVNDGPSAVQIAKQARERLKAAKTRRFAARIQGVVTHGEPAWLIEYRPLKSGGFKAFIRQPEAQTQAVLDRIRDACIATIGV